MKLALTREQQGNLISSNPVKKLVLLADVIQPEIEKYVDDFVQDMSHINDVASYSGGLRVDAIVNIKDNLYRCDYSYEWLIAWNCAGIQESGRVSEKVRFQLEEKSLDFKFLTFD